MSTPVRQELFNGPQTPFSVIFGSEQLAPLAPFNPSHFHKCSELLSEISANSPFMQVFLVVPHSPPSAITGIIEPETK